ncbi:MAG: hypothetical protein A2Y62_16745 [Candidatus Fischerbacteria bacterium RBG_13_37_8]|uniref:FAD-binding domain-containing protein n=1 Tax=Candidatus Fischerbacteria bacterium RBG_13_37_8 TaxID=1817863 RepID=A0A1F5VJQ0_9BACT|nr:MAG: hypothetical protein A2Y62_16745 [Candidatus Fischerbacteria bacterium RBG_13_37_8]
MNNNYYLEDNSKIAVIGGGPSGTLFSIFASKMARMVDKKVDITIFEPKDFTQYGPNGCNKCGGVISELLVQVLAVEGINLPPNVVQRGINSYVLHTVKGDVEIVTPAMEKKIATVYRGGGPKDLKEKDLDSFDDFLLKYAVKEGAVHVPLKIEEIRQNDKMVLASHGKAVLEADLVVGAFGVNSTTHKLFENLNMCYQRPATTSAFITELELGTEMVSHYFGSSIHFFLLPVPKNIKFAALIPKGKYVTLCILGKNIDKNTVKAFLDSPVTQSVLPEQIAIDKFCKCYPKLSVSCAKKAFDNRMVIIGDAGSTRLFKDGLGASYIMGKAAAMTAIFHGVSKKDFARHYLPVYRKTNIDNLYGRYLYLITDIYKNVTLLTEGMVEVVSKEQKRSEDTRRLSSILWDTFTGNETYKNIALRAFSMPMHIELGLSFIKALGRRLT